jgi:hypothetical protein
LFPNMNPVQESPQQVFLVTSGDGADGDEIVVHSIHSTLAGAEKAKVAFEAPRKRADGSTYSFCATVEVWELKE